MPRSESRMWRCFLSARPFFRYVYGQDNSDKVLCSRRKGKSLDSIYSLALSVTEKDA